MQAVIKIRAISVLMYGLDPVMFVLARDPSLPSVQAHVNECASWTITTTTTKVHDLL